jgi:hypothetical protein
VSVGQELLARRAGEVLSVELHDIVFLNGALYPELHRPLDVHCRLLDPTTGPKLSQALDERASVNDLAPTFARG